MEIVVMSGFRGIGCEELFVQTKFTLLAGQDPRSISYNPSCPLNVQVSQSFAQQRINEDLEIFSFELKAGEIEAISAILL